MRAAFLLAILVLLAGAGVLLLACGGDEERIAQHAPGRYDPDGRLLDPPRARSRPARNLVVLVVDTLRDDCVGDSPERPGDMPFLTALAARGARLTQVSAPASWTFPSLASLLTGQLPDRHRVDQMPTTPELPAGTTTFAEALAQGNGYETAAVMELRMEDVPDSILQGFGHVRSGGPLRFARAEISRWNQARSKERPFFLLLHTYEAHDPYGERNHPWPALRPLPALLERVPAMDSLDDAALVERFLLDAEAHTAWLARDQAGVLERTYDYYARGYRSAPDRALADRLEKAYRRGVRWVDREIEKTVALLEQEGLLQDTLLLVTSDHGEAFGEHGLLNHGRSLHEEHVHVPCVVLGPAPFCGGRVLDTSVGLVDLIPTFFELADVPAVPGGAGRSMLTALADGAAGRPVLGVEFLTPFKMGRRFASPTLMVSARDARWSYLIELDTGADLVREHLYDRSADPTEAKNLAGYDGLGDVSVNAAMVEAIESARDRIWKVFSARRGSAGGGMAPGSFDVPVRPPAVRAGSR